ncbi:hypothetical protein MHYP_G00041040 [Metynnis hypsauchen]
MSLPAAQHSPLSRAGLNIGTVPHPLGVFIAAWATDREQKSPQTTSSGHTGTQPFRFLPPPFRERCGQRQESQLSQVFSATTKPSDRVGKAVQAQRSCSSRLRLTGKVPISISGSRQSRWRYEINFISFSSPTPPSFPRGTPGNP